MSIRPPTRVAILGSGIFAKEAHLPALAALGGALVQVKAVYSRSSKSSSAFADLAGKTLGLGHPLDVYNDEDDGRSLDVLLARSDIDAVIVVLPITTQPDVIRKAFAAGKHVLSEKPVGPDVASGRALIQEYEAKYKYKDIVWRVAENFEAEPAYQAASRLVQEGKLGNVKFYNARAYSWVDEHSKWYNTPWRTVPDYQGGFLLDGGVHTIAALRLILPSPFTTVSAHASLAKSILVPHDTINAIVRSEDGSHGIVELSWGGPIPSRVSGAHNNISVTGDKGWLEATRTSNGIQITVHTAVLDDKGKPVYDEETGTWKEDVQVIEERSCGIEKEIESWVRAIDGNDDGLDAPRGTLVDVAFIEAALNSNGEPVDLQKLVNILAVLPVGSGGTSGSYQWRSNKHTASAASTSASCRYHEPICFCPFIHHTTADERSAPVGLRIQNRRAWSWSWSWSRSPWCPRTTPDPATLLTRPIT